MNDKVKYIITGALAGVANGLFGSGGGLFLVPLFVSWLHMEQKKAFATSVAAAFLGARMEVGLLRRLFGVLLLYIGARELFAKAPKKEPAEK